jgi:tetratricopeptide (TPR) repeat protein
VLNFANHYNDGNIMQKALNESKADKEYHEAIAAFDKGDFDAFIKYFFLAIHSRYDIEKPGAKRLIRRKLNIINRQKAEIDNLRDEICKHNEMLKRLSAEYTLMGKECEHEHMTEAAIANYQKALELYPEAHDAKHRLEKINKKNK